MQMQHVDGLTVGLGSFGASEVPGGCTCIWKFCWWATGWWKYSAGN